jgi:hypothetical protein
MRLKQWFYSLIVLAFLGVFAHAQTPTGTIQGLVTDKSGAAVQGATITVTKTTTNEQRQSTTDSAGRFNVPFVEPATYNIAASATGFRKAEQQNVLIQVTETRSVNFVLEVGTVNQSVEVNATTQTLDVDTSSLGETIQSQTLLDLPDNGRNIFDFALLVPGVNNGVSGSSEAGASTPHIGGSRNGNNEQLIDGMTNILPENNVGNNESAYLPVEDSIQEENVQTSVPAAEYGRFSGGIISLNTKSGTNQLHGSFYEFIQNGALDAIPFGTPGAVNTGKKPDMHQYQTGGTIGGPIVFPGFNGHDRAFFFFDFEDSRASAGQTSTYSVPNPAWLTGDFTSLYGSTTPMLFDPDTVAKNASGVYVRQPLMYNGEYNVINPARISPVAAAALPYFPKPNIAGAGTYNNYQQTGAVPTDYWHFDSRIDVDVTKKWHSFLRYSELNQTGSTLNDYNNAASPGNYGGTYHTPDFSGSFNNTVTFSSTLLGEFRYGFSKQDYNRVPVGGNFDPTKLGFDSGYAAQAALEADMFPHFGFSGNGSFSDLGPLGYEQYQEDPLAQDINGSLVKIVGAHSIKVGGEFRALRNNFYQWSYPSGTFTADDSWTRQFPQSQDATGFSVASLLLGLPSGGDITEDEKSISTSQYWAFYGQDDWKISPKLTLNIGLRYDWDVPHEEARNQLSYWDPNAPSPLGKVAVASGVTCPACSNLLGAMTIVGTPGAKYGRRQVPTPRDDFGPRFGLAYNPSPKVVIRAGGGLIFQPSAFQAAGTTGAPGNEGFATQTNFNPSFTNQDNLPVATLYSPDPVILAANPGAGTPYPNYSTPQGHQASCLSSAACVAGIDLGNQLQNSYFDSFRTPYSIEWNGNVQFAIPFGIKLELGYLANKGLFLIDGDPGKPYDQLSTGTLAQYGCTPGAPTSACQLLNQVANPFDGIIGPGTTYTVASSGLTSSSTVEMGQLLKRWPQYSSVSSFRKPDSASMYNGFTLRADKQLTHGLAFTFSLTDGREYDNAASPVNYLGGASQTYADQYNPKAEWAIGAQNISYEIASSFLYQLPFGHGQAFLNNGNLIADKIINGWQVTGIENWSTGQPIVLGSVDNGTTKNALWGGNAPFNQRPAWNGQSAKLQNPTYKEWFNPNVFSIPASFAIGNAPRALWATNNPNYQDLDLAVAKNTMWGATERYNVQFRLEMFNAFNHPSLANPNNTLTSGQFGVISGYEGIGARRIQIAAKVVF